MICSILNSHFTTSTVLELIIFSAATIGPLFTGVTTCGISDVNEVYNEYVDWSFMFYKYSSGRLMADAFFTAMNLIKQASEDASCTTATTIPCSLIEPGAIDLSDLKVSTLFEETTKIRFRLPRLRLLIFSRT